MTEHHGIGTGALHALISTALVASGCAAQKPAPAPSAPVAKEPAADVSDRSGDAWTNDLDSVRASTSGWTSLEIVDGGERIDIAPEFVTRIASMVSQCSPGEGWAATTPPWPSAVMEARAGERVVAVFQIQASGIRVDSEHPYQPSLGSMHDESGPRVHDCLLDYDEHQWLWDLHAEVLGPTATKEYQTVPPRRPSPLDDL